MDVPMSMARSVMRLGPVHVVVVVPSAGLRASLVSWLRTNKRVRIVRAVATAADLGPHRLECDLVVASAFDGARELRALRRRFDGQAGLAALVLSRTAPLPAGWVPVRPRASHNAVLDLAMPHPERAVAKTWTAISAVVVALVALVLSPFYIPDVGASFQRAALAYAARWPDASVWWHVWGAGAPALAAASWPLLKLASRIGGGPEVFELLAGIVGALYGASFVLLAARAGAKRLAIVAGLLAVVPPAMWAWPRGGDAAGLLGLCGLTLALAGTLLGRTRLPAIAFAVALSAFAGYLWVAASALAAIAAGLRAKRIRVSTSGAVLGTLMATAVAAPPLLSRGIDGLRPALARPIALSDLAPVLATFAIVAFVMAQGRARVPLWIGAALMLVAANVLVYEAPVGVADVPRIPATGALTRLAVHPTQALTYAVDQPDLPTTGADVDPSFIVGQRPRDLTSAHLEWLGVDRAVVPDRSAAIVFTERDWQVLDRERLILKATRTRPILTAGVTATLLVVADPGDAALFGEALERIGATSEIAIPVRASKQLDELDRDTLRSFTMIVVYGQPWKDAAKAEQVLSDYLRLSGFVYMDVAARAGKQPLLPEARTVHAAAGDVRASGDAKLVTASGFEGRAVAIDEFRFDDDPGWEQAALLAGNKRVLHFGQSNTGLGVAVAPHLVWSGVDLPARTAAGDDAALVQLRTALSWMLGAANVRGTPSYGTPNGDVLDNDTAVTTFVDPAHWRIDLKAATTGILFKERYHDQWRAQQIDVSALTGQESRASLVIRPTVNGFMFVTLPPNARRVDFVFERHPYDNATRGLAAVAFFVTAITSVFLLRRR